MSSDAVIDPVRAHHHGHGVPPYDASYVALYFVVARVARLVLKRDGVYVRGVRRVGNPDAFFLGVYPELSEQFCLPFRDRNFQSRIQVIRSIPGLQLLLPIFEDLLPSIYTKRGKAGPRGNLQRGATTLLLLSRIRPQALKKVLWTRSGSPDSEKQFNRKGKNITTPTGLFRLLFYDYIDCQNFW